MRLRTILCCTALAAGLLPAPGHAGIVFTLGNNPQPDEENVLLNTGTTGTTVFGTTNQTGVPVRFTSTQTLSEPPNGQARIEATSGTGQVGLTNVAISVPGGTYGDLIFNPDITGNIGTPSGTLHVSATDNFGGVFPFDYTLGNGNNFLTIRATGGERIASTSLSYSLAAGFTDLRQVRISGVTVAAVPEPSTLVSASLLAGLAGLGCWWRRRRAARPA
jgi:hypothetical protein